MCPVLAGVGETHFHVRYAEYKGRIVIETGEVLPGATLPRRALQLAEEWRRIHLARGTVRRLGRAQVRSFAG